MNDIVERIRKRLRENIDQKALSNSQRFFKGPVKCYGVRMPECRKIARQFRPEVQNFNKPKIFGLCESLLVSDYCEEAYIISSWLPKMVEQFDKDDGFIFKDWIDKYVNNWAKCDSFCNHTIGVYVMKFPEFIDELKEWALSNNRWIKRVAAVFLIIPARKNHLLNDIFEISDRLLLDKDDLVQKDVDGCLNQQVKHTKKRCMDMFYRTRKKCHGFR